MTSPIGQHFRVISKGKEFKMADTQQKTPGAERSEKLQNYLILVLQAIMVVGLVLAVIAGHWQDVLTVTGIIVLVRFPGIISRRSRLFVPPEFELMAVLFVFASLFLGELHGYYTRYWWWDIALHTLSGLLLGIFGFLLIYVLNEDDTVEMRLKPRFVALFAFFFAVAVGALWEIFEFSMDQLAGLNMQKPMLDDPSGLTDTMWDLIVDTIGAAIVSVVGWWHMRMSKRSIFDNWIQKFLRSNPQLFSRDT